MLPGVTVTLNSEALMGSRDTVTSETGTFRFISITPGLYTVTFELAGFATVKRTDIQVGAGFTATLNISMNVASLQEAVTVSGASPVVDTQSTTVTTSFDSAKLAALPNGSNDPWATLAETRGGCGPDPLASSPQGTVQPRTGRGTMPRPRARDHKLTRSHG